MLRPVTLSVSELAQFSPDYFSARETLLTLSRQCDESVDICSRCLQAEPGDESASLTTEVVWLGPRSASRVVVLISATHGVEGFVGAAIQSDLLRRIKQGYTLPADMACLIVFALNPYGFAHYRRCDEKGIDLNRNFIDFKQVLPENEGYEHLREFIYSEDSDYRHDNFAKLRQQWGDADFEIALSGGQYTDPYGPFYGGVAAAHGHQTIDWIIKHHQLAGRKMVVIDIHSGLGPYAHGEIINDHPLESGGHKKANNWFGGSVTSPLLGDSSSVRKHGLLDYHWHPLMTQHGCYITLEFGSYPTQALFDVVIEDHRSWKSGEQAAKESSARAMAEHFCPEDSYWRELVLVKARQVIEQAIFGLEHDDA